MTSRIVGIGEVRGAPNGPIEACVVRRKHRGRAIMFTIALDIEAMAEQAEVEGEDGPSATDRVWW